MQGNPILNSQRNSGNSFNITNSIYLYKGQKIIVNAKGCSTSVGMICIYHPWNDTYESVVPSVDSEAHDYTWVATENCYVRCSYNKTEAITIRRITEEPFSATLSEQQSNIDAIESRAIKNRVEYPQMFDNILCIGDSLTVGWRSANDDEPLTKNYPHFITKLARATTTIKAHGGYTAKQVWDNIISSATDLANYDCAIIYLGTNEGLTDTVNVDCKADYTQNTDNNTGCYGKIIGKIKADVQNCQIFCVAGPAEYIARESTMNPAVRALAAFYEVGLADVSDSILADNGNGNSIERKCYRPNDAIHYNVLGYLTLANVIYDVISDYIGTNLRKYSSI